MSSNIINEYSPVTINDGVRFSFVADDSTKSVALAGTFNHWNGNRDFLEKDADGIWRLTIKLDRGRHLYKFVVNDTIWIPDPNNPNMAEDCQNNSSITVNELGQCMIRNNSINKKHPGYFYKNHKAVESSDWVYKAIIYELHIESFTNNGFSGMIDKLDYLKELGVNTLWLMPIHPISKERRIGTYGDPYAVKDFYSIRKNLGTPKDYKNFIDKAHEMGFRIIMDWTLNRVGYDCPLVKENAAWFTHDQAGNPCYRIPDRDYFVGIDFMNNDVVDYIIRAMKYWINEFNIDGYRFDDSDLVPHEVLSKIRRELKLVKSEIMLLSQSYDEVHHAESCDLTYEGSLKEMCRDIIQGLKTSKDFRKHFESMKYSFPSGALRNRWIEGKEDTRIIDYIGNEAVYPLATLLLTMDSIPFILMGQETGDLKWNTWTSLFEDFELDLDCIDKKLMNHYKRYIDLRKSDDTFTLGELEFIDTKNDKVIAYKRVLNNKERLVIVSLSAKEEIITLKNKNIVIKQYDTILI